MAILNIFAKIQRMSSKSEENYLKTIFKLTRSKKSATTNRIGELLKSIVERSVSKVRARYYIRALKIPTTKHALGHAVAMGMIRHFGGSNTNLFQLHPHYRKLKLRGKNVPTKS